MCNLEKEEPLILSFRGRIIEHLGLQLYSRPVSAIAEIVANAWDAEATRVDITLPEAITHESVIIVQDNGVGMTRKECQNCYLQVGLNRRGRDPLAKSKHGKRSLMGRKGIGKFAGFGIAQTITIETMPEDGGVPTGFFLDGERLMSVNEDKNDYVQTTEPIKLEEKTVETKSFPDGRGTRVTLSGLTLQRGFCAQTFAASMARRFFLNSSQDEFDVYINGHKMPDDIDIAGVSEFYPKDYADGSHEIKLLENGWGEEEIRIGDSSMPIQWRILFFKTPLKGDDALKGVSVFANKKLVQVPFFFDIGGGFQAQTALEYLAGGVVADFLDQQNKEFVSTDRQQINWERPESEALKLWGQKRIKELCKLWADRRSSQRKKLVEERVERYKERVRNLEFRHAKVAEKVLNRLANVQELEEAQFIDISDAVLAAFEVGLLEDFIGELDEKENLTEADVLRVFKEANVLTAFYMSQLVGMKLEIIARLHKMLDTGEVENDVRDLIAENPWIIGPAWETYKVEKGLSTIKTEAETQAKASTKVELDEYVKGKRIDLALSSGNEVLLLEFMRPGLRVDWDHVNRMEAYFFAFKGILSRETTDPEKIRTLKRCYLIAETDIQQTALQNKIETMKISGMYVLSWDRLFKDCIDQWRLVLDAYLKKTPDDPRIKELEKYLK